MQYECHWNVFLYKCVIKINVHFEKLRHWVPVKSWSSTGIYQRPLMRQTTVGTLFRQRLHKQIWHLTRLNPSGRQPFPISVMIKSILLLGWVRKLHKRAPRVGECEESKGIPFRFCGNQQCHIERALSSLILLLNNWLHLQIQKQQHSTHDRH